MKYGLLVYKDINDTYNVGDYIQSLAAEQYLPRVDMYLNREELSSYKGSKIKLIMNGWFTHDIENWAPSDDIIPLFVSFHLNGRIAEEFLSIPENLSYLKKHEPIGCRDHSTMRVLAKYNINNYFTGCLTLTLGKKYKSNNLDSNNIICADVAFDTPSFSECFQSLYDFYIKGIRKKGLLNFTTREKIINKILNFSHEKIFLNHIIKKESVIDHSKRLDVARDYLDKISKSKLVITSRIHSGLPAAGIGIPNIFIHSGFNHVMDSSRFEGLLDILNVLYLNKNNYDDFTFNNKEDVNKLITLLPKETIELQKKVESFICA